MNAVVTARAPLTFWGAVVHLVRFDARRFRVLLALVAGLEIARAAFVEWALHLAPVTIGERFGGAFGTEEVAFFDGLLLLLATGITTAVIVQADLPSDDRAFWRTRPIAPIALAVSKLTLFGLLFAALPAAINIARLVAYGAPTSAWIAATLQILLQAGGMVAPAWALALATRTLPRFLAAVGVLLVGGFLALGALAYWLARGAGGMDIARFGSVGFGWEGDSTALVMPAVLTAFAFAILVVHYRLRRRLVTLTAGVVLLAIATLVPNRRDTSAAAPELVQLVDGGLRLPGSVGLPASWVPQGGPGYLTGRIEMPAPPADVSAAISLADTHVVVDGRRIAVHGAGQCCAGPGPIGVVAPASAWPPLPPASDTALVFGLAAPLLPEVAGRRITIEADADVRFARHRLVAAVPLRPGASFRTDRYLLEILGQEPGRRVLLIRFARFPRFAEGRTEGLSLFVADRARTRIITTAPMWRVAPADAASGSFGWAQGRTWSGRFHVLMTGIAPPPPDAELLIVETRPAGVAHTTLSATNVEVRAPRLE